MRAEVDKPIDVLCQAKDIDCAQIGCASPGDDGVQEIGVHGLIVVGLDVHHDVGILLIEGLDLGLNSLQGALEAPYSQGAALGSDAGSGTQAASGCQSPGGGECRAS